MYLLKVRIIRVCLFTQVIYWLVAGHLLALKSYSHSKVLFSAVNSINSHPPFFAFDVY